MDTNTTNQNTTEQISTQTETSTKRRGRPKMDVTWPKGTFTFNSLKAENSLSPSSLRKKLRSSLVKGGLVKVNTLKTAFGRPQTVYEKV